MDEWRHPLLVTFCYMDSIVILFALSAGYDF